ncbi:DUF2868 domain-containing protein [Taylorella equigenitalis]|uniref:DUF2868 domain-containing protein n=1 Tax=Taylorella equigenitalis TaxID=29575 RepID=UPI00240D4E50|nr:DUF2868 domain-containing protein [Taylorella equigenitalis]WFE07244.1 DUF2868 domain-containing protein [Taylorella equigenitalis]WGQ22253.1 DUF2868 domain-containing protein [Taylorella equigenitalis]
MRFRDLWTVETISNTEAEIGPFEDQQIVYSLRTERLPIKQKIIARAHKLALRDSIAQSMDRWALVAKLSTVLFVLFAILSGAGLAYGNFGPSNSSINILNLYVTLLGVNLIAFTFWILTFFFTKFKVTPLGRVWIWISEKISSTPSYVRSFHAFLTTIGKAGATKWLFSTLSHGFWLLNLVTATILIMLLLATRSYSFNWETTILSSSSFADFVDFVGYVPSLLGFELPSKELIINSSNTISGFSEDHKKWSWWVLGQLTVWGILLRFIAFVFSSLMLKTKLKKADIDLESTGIATLVKRLQYKPIQTYRPSDTHNQKYDLESIRVNSSALPNLGKITIAGVDLSSRQIWPPFKIKEGVVDAGHLNSRSMKNKFISKLSDNHVDRLLVVLDSKPIPDRGIQYLVKSFSQYASDISVYLLNSYQEGLLTNRAQIWIQTLRDIGIKENNIHTDESDLGFWRAS